MRLLRNILNKLKNPYTVIGITACIVTILNTFGVVMDNTKVDLVIQSVCTIFILLGIMNNPDTTGLS